MKVIKPIKLNNSFDSDALLKEFMSEAELELDENIEKHEELNPALFDQDKKLLPEVKAKLMAIAAKFLELLEKNNIAITIDDIIVAGSNANYNYTENSDIDLHLLTTVTNNDKGALYKALYDAYRNIFAKKFDISIHGIPVEVYVETEDKKSASGGIYSIRQDNWIKEPEITEIPEINQEEFNRVYAELEGKCEDLLHADYGTEVTEEDVENLITELYTIRQAGLDEAGEFSTGNLVFKELRNNGYLDLLKQLRDEITSKELSLEAFKPVESGYIEEAYISGQDLFELKQRLTTIARKTPTIDAGGNFTFYNLKENEARLLVRKLQEQEFIQEVRMVDSGKYDFGSFNSAQPWLPNKTYNVQGTIIRS